MKKISILALVVALGFTSATYAQGLSASAGVDAGVSASAGGIDVSASTGIDASASTDVSASTSAEASASGEVGASASGEVGISSEMSSMMSSDAMAGDMSCTDLDASTIATTDMDAVVIAAATNVTVFDIANCSGLSDLATIDTNVQTNLGANANVVAALQAAGESGSQIIGYTVDGTSLVVYVQKK